MKTEKSIERKIKTNSQGKNETFEDAAKKIKDSIRYTSIADESNFVSSYHSTKQNLEKMGYEEIACKNYFNLYNEGKAHHKQITSVFRDPNGTLFELQFHTPKSIKAKELKTPLYEESRNLLTSEERKDSLTQEMDRLMEQVPDPKDVKSIESYDSSDSFTTSKSSLKRMSGGWGDESPDTYSSEVLSHLKIPVEPLNALKKIQSESDIEDIRRDINHRDEEVYKEVADTILSDTGRQYNCRNCACAFELVERGYDVTARREPDGSNVGNIADLFKGGKLQQAIHSDWEDNPIRLDARSMSFRKYSRIMEKYNRDLQAARDESIGALRESLEKQGPGARGIIVVGWLQDYSADLTTAFHALNYKINKDGSAILYDTQSYRKCNGTPDFGMLYGCDPRELHYMRTDILDVTGQIARTVYSRGRSDK